MSLKCSDVVKETDSLFPRMRWLLQFLKHFSHFSGGVGHLRVSALGPKCPVVVVDVSCFIAELHHQGFGLYLILGGLTHMRIVMQFCLVGRSVMGLGVEWGHECCVEAMCVSQGRLPSSVLILDLAKLLERRAGVRWA